MINVRRMSGLVVAVVAAALFTTGCGGGGGGSTSARLTPGAAVQQRSRAWNNALIREDLDGLMALYSAAFVTDDGQTKEQTRLENQLLFERYDFLQIDVLSEELIVNSAGTAVQVDGSYRVTVRDRQTGEQPTMQVDSLMEWGKEGNSWLLVHEYQSGGSTQSVTTAMARRKQ